MSRNNKEEVVDEPVVDEPVVEIVAPLTIKQKIEAQLAKAHADKAAAEKKEAELESLANLSDDAMSMVDVIAALDSDISVKKAAFTELVKPYQDEINSAKVLFDAEVKETVDARTAEYAKLVAEIGDVGATMLTGKVSVTGTGTGKGRGRNGNTREALIVEVCDNGLDFETVARKLDHMGGGERDGKQKVGYLVGRHINLAIGEGKVVKNSDGTYSRA